MSQSTTTRRAKMSERVITGIIRVAGYSSIVYVNLICLFLL